MPWGTKCLDVYTNPPPGTSFDHWTNLALELGLCCEHQIKLQTRAFTALSGDYQHHTSAFTIKNAQVKSSRN